MTQKKKPSDPWKESFGRRPFRLTVKERADKDHVVYAYFRLQGKKVKCSLDILIKDAHGGRDPDKLQEVLALAKKMLALLCGGADPRAALAKPQRTPAPAALTLKGGIDWAYAAPGSMFQKETSYVRDMKAHATKFAASLSLVAPTWADLSPLAYRTAWRRIIADTANEGKDTKGLRALELGIHAVKFVAKALAQHEKVGSLPKMPPTGWKEQLKLDWAEAFTDGDTQALVPARPRFTHDEIARLIAACSLPQVDPRVGLAFMLGLEARLGQVGRCMRSHLSEVPGEEGDLKLRIPGKKSKRGTVVLLTPQERDAVQHALKTGFLSELERSRCSGRLKDFPLLPGGRLRDGKAPVRDGLRPMNDRTLYDKFVQLEAVAGVEHLDGRGWYGARRTAVDLVSVTTDDEDTKNHITGHKDSATRGIYMDAEAPARLKSIRAVRQKARESAGGRRKSKDATRDR